MKLAEAYVEIRIDRKKAESEAKSAADGALSAIRNVFAAGVVIKGLQEAIGQASDLNETISKTGVIFGDSSKEITAWSQNSAKQLGLSQRAALDAASTFATFGKSAGLAGQDLTGFATNLTGLSSDLASFYNTSPETAIEAIGAALRGESEPIRQFGVLLDDATLKQRAMTMGLYDGKGALDQHARVLAAQAEILAQTSDAQGDFARTADGLANSQRIAAAEAEDSAASFGQVLLPVYKRVLEVVTFLVDKFGNLPGPVQTAIVALAGVIAFSGPLGKIKDVVVDLAQAFVNAGISASQVGLALGAVGGVLALAGGLYYVYSQDKAKAKKITDDFVGALQEETQGQKDALKALIARKIVDSDYLSNVAPKLKLSQQDIADVITGKSVPAYEKLKAGLEGILDGNLANEKKTQALADTYGVTAIEARQFLVQLEGLRDGYSSAVEKTAALDEANKALGVSTDGAATATTGLGAATAAAGSETTLWNELLGKSKAAQEGAAEASETLADKQKEATDRIKDQRDALDDLYDALYGAIDGSRAYERALDDDDAALQDYRQTLIESKGDQEAITDAARDTADQLISTAKQYAELQNGNLNSKAAIDDMIKSLYDQAVKLAPGDPLRQNLLDYISELQKIPTKIDTTLSLNVTGQTITKTGDFIGIRDIPGKVVQKAQGGYIPGRTNLLSTLAEQGPEAVLPLDKPNRLTELLGDPRIGGPVADALGGGGSTVATSVTTINAPITVYGAERSYVRSLRDQIRQLEREQT